MSDPAGPTVPGYNRSPFVHLRFQIETCRMNRFLGFCGKQAHRGKDSGVGAVEDDAAPLAVAVAEHFARAAADESIGDRIAFEFADSG